MIDLFFFLLGCAITVGAAAYFSDGFVLPRNNAYKSLIGKYHLWNYSREHRGSLLCADVNIYPRFMKTPGVTVIYKRGGEEWPFMGRLYISAERLYMMLENHKISERDPTLIVFEPPEASRIRIGFAAGFEIPQRPYAGVQLLCDQGVTKEEVQSILGEDKGDDSQNRLNYYSFSARRNELRGRIDA